MRNSATCGGLSFSVPNSTFWLTLVATGPGSEFFDPQSLMLHFRLRPVLRQHDGDATIQAHKQTSKDFGNDNLTVLGDEK